VWRLVCVLGIFILATAPLQAGEWPVEAELQMEAAGQRLVAASTTAQRVAALGELEAIASNYPEADGARWLATTLSQEATIEIGPSAMLDALSILAASEKSRILTPMAQLSAR